MRFSKGVLLLAALMAVVGVFGFTDKAEAVVQVSSVSIATPSDSGAIRGIDSLITVEVTIQALSPDPKSTVVIWLFGADSSKVLTDDGGTKQIANAGADTTLDTEEEVVVAAKVGGSVSAAKSGTGAFPVGRGMVLVQATYNDGEKGPATTGRQKASPLVGDGTSVLLSASKFTWKYKLDASVGTVTGIRAAAFAIDGADGTTGSVITSPNNVKINVDGDRPDDSALATAGGILVPANFENTDLDDTNATVDDAITGNVAGVTGQTTGSKVYEKVVFNTGPGPSSATFSSTSRPVLGIGDSLRMRVDLGTVGTQVVFGDSLRIDAEILGKTVTLDKSRRPTTASSVVLYTKTIAAADYTSTTGANPSPATHTVGVYLVDQAGNRSSRTGPASTIVSTDKGPDADAPAGVTIAATFVVDSVLPTLDGATAVSDTILPASNDTITDGSLNTSVSNDLNAIQYKLAEALDTLFVTFNDKITLRVNQGSGTRTDANASLKSGATRIINFTTLGNVGPVAAASDTFQVAESTGANPVNFIGGSTTTGHIKWKAAADTQITTGLYTIKFQGRDLAGNLGGVLTRTNVLVDVDDIDLERLFPTAASALDTLEEETSKVVFQLSEVADSVKITYTGLLGVDKDSTRTRALAGSELTNVTSEQTFPITLINNTQYTLRIIAADLAGNYTITSQDTFVYDTSFVVPVIASFDIAASPAGGVAAASHVATGAAVTLTLTAKTINDASAVTYKAAAVLKVATGSGVTLAGTGVTDLGNGRATLSADDWVVGSRTVTLKDTTSEDTLTVAIQDCTDATNIYVGSLDSSIVITAGARTKIVVDADEIVGQGDMFWVDVTYADVYGNARVTDNGFVSVSANKLGVEVPVGDVPMTKGMGGFWAKSSSWSGDGLIITARDVILNGNAPTVLSGVDTIAVTAEGVLGAPATIIAKDYMGAKGTGDQGGFITLSFTPSADHATLSGYRIYREVAVFSGYNTATPPALVELSEPMMAMVPWGIVDAVPGADPVHVVVATLDGDSTVYGVAAERGGLTTAKSAFDGAESVTTPYEMLAETMQKSRAAATDGPVFAALTPEALAFSANGIVPRMKLVDGVEQSSITQTASAVRSVDNIAPETVPFIQTMDTPDDAGSSITVTWAKSPSDQMVTQVVPQAIGGTNVYTTAGVKGYNVYRKVGDAAYTLVGSANAGETTFTDETAFNGVRYTYQVRPFDADNITASEVEKSAMAIRNNVVDASGAPVYGLFGIDNKVDYDDFFIFADHYGLSAGDDAFDKAFDLAPNNTVDFDDFFAFADNFGREIVATGKVVPMMAGLNSDARFYLDAGSDLPRVGEELVIDVNLENYIELQAYGFGMNYDATVLEFVGARVENNILGEGQLAQPQVIAQGEGTVSLGAFGDVATKGDLGLSLVFRTLEEIEASYIELTEGGLQDGSYGLNSVTGPVSVRIETRPEVYALSDNYPNPFNPETTIKYQLPNAGDVTLEVYNMLGQVVRTLVSEQQNAGRYVLQWDATSDAGHALSSGIYFYRIQAGGEFQSVKKMLLLK